MKINTLYYKELRNEEFLGIHKNFVELTANITAEEILPSIEVYRTSVTEFANLIEVSVDESAACIASRLDKERNIAYTACKNFVKSIKLLPDSEMQTIGSALWKLITENADPLKLNQDQSTGIYENLIAGFKNFGDASLTKCGFKPYLENLERKQAEYLTAVQTRNKELAAKETGVNKVYREKCLEAFNLVAALAIVRATVNKDDACTQFIKAVNNHIDQKKVQLKIRKGKGKTTATPETPEAAVAKLHTETKEEENAA